MTKKTAPFTYYNSQLQQMLLCSISDLGRHLTQHRDGLSHIGFNFNDDFCKATVGKRRSIATPVSTSILTFSSFMITFTVIGWVEECSTLCMGNSGSLSPRVSLSSTSTHSDLNFLNCVFDPLGYALIESNCSLVLLLGMTNAGKMPSLLAKMARYILTTIIEARLLLPNGYTVDTHCGGTIVIKLLGACLSSFNSYF